MQGTRNFATKLHVYTVLFRTVGAALMRVCITGSGGLHKLTILHIPGSTRPAEMSGSHKVNWRHRFV